MGARRVLVAQSYFLNFDPKLRDAGKPVPPLGSLICAAVLRARGFEVAFFDAMLGTSPEDCAEIMDRERPGTLVIFEDSFNYLSKMCLERMREAASRMIALASDRKVRVVVAGSSATDDPEFFLRSGASAVAMGEAEFSVAEWLEAGVAERPALPGIVTVDSQGRLVRGAVRPPIRDLDQLPMPAWDLIDVERYRQAWMSRHGRFELPMATSRGCPFHCNWCSKPIWGQRYNSMSPARAAREVEVLQGLGATHLNFLDDILGLKPGWVEEFGTEVRRRGPTIPFRCLSRADLLEADFVASLAGAGCEMVWIGAESGSQSVLDAMEKGTTVESIRNSATRLRRAGIKVGFFIQFGYPGETRGDIDATLALIDDVLPDDIGISVSYPLPGTPFYDRVRHEMAGSTHWQDSGDLAMLFRGPHGTGFYRLLHTHAHARFRLGRALRGGASNLMTRGLQILRQGLVRAVTGTALSVLSRNRTPTRSLAPGRSREEASVPGERERG